MKKVKDYMKKRVIYFSPEDSVFKTAKVLSKHNISGAPVVKNGKVVGVISDTDVIKFIRLKVPGQGILTHEPHMLTLLVMNLLKGQIDFKRELKRISKIKVKDIMCKDIISVSLEASILEAAELMEKYDVTRLPVIEKGKLRGIISKTDMIRALIE